VKKPILVIQMQRMGDLILSFPLFLWLERAFPGHPVWVMAEPIFARPLMRLSPQVRYFEYAQEAKLRQQDFHLVVNLSHRPQSMDLAGSLRCDSLVGGYTRKGVTRIEGDWQEYRLSLTHNNRHNRFHWADLNAMDVVPHRIMQRTGWPAPRVMPPEIHRIGLFLGASEPDKRPGPGFWADLVVELERADFDGFHFPCREVEYNSLLYPLVNNPPRLPGLSHPYMAFVEKLDCLYDLCLNGRIIQHGPVFPCLFNYIFVSSFL